MADVKLLPLPWSDVQPNGRRWLFNPEDRPRVEDYARTNMEPLIAEIEALRAEIAEARDGWHMANGTADLAMKHRDAAEARAERLAEASAEVEALAVRVPGGFSIPYSAANRLFALLREQEEGK